MYIKQIIIQGFKRYVLKRYCSIGLPLHSEYPMLTSGQLQGPNRYRTLLIKDQCYRRSQWFGKKQFLRSHPLCPQRCLHADEPRRAAGASP